MFIVYLIKNLINSKIYIGYSSTDFQTRWDWHFLCACNGENWLLSRAIRKYGPENFSYGVLKTVQTKKEASDLEIYWVKTIGSYLPEIGYNMTMGGEGGSPNEETRRKISASLTGRKFGPRGSWSVEQKQAMSERMKGVGKGVKKSAEFCQILSTALKGHDTPQATRDKIGNTLRAKYANGELDYLKEKISIANTGRKPPKTGRTHKEYFGEERAKEISEKLKRARSLQTFTSETKKKMSESQKERQRRQRRAHYLRICYSCFKVVTIPYTLKSGLDLTFCSPECSRNVNKALKRAA